MPSTIVEIIQRASAAYGWRVNDVELARLHQAAREELGLPELIAGSQVTQLMDMLHDRVGRTEAPAPRTAMLRTAGIAALRTQSCPRCGTSCERQRLAAGGPEVDYCQRCRIVI